jgi:hypothetical protein
MVPAVILVAAASLLIPGFFASSRVSNTHASWIGLKTLSTAEADFRANDRDWNHVNDYWTGDVKSLYTLTSCAVKGAKGMPDDPSIKLIELSLACSDADGTLIEAGGENMPLSSFSVPSAKRGYWHAALTLDQTVRGAEATYRADTGGEPPMGSCHHLSRFGFVAMPDSQSSGPFAYIINEKCTIYRMALFTAPGDRDPLPAPPGLKWIRPECMNWPEDQTLKSWWSKLD